MNFLLGAEDLRTKLDTADLVQKLTDLFRADSVDDVETSSMSTLAVTEIWLQSATVEAELRVLVNYDGVITVSRVQVNHPRTGVFTKIMAVLEDACAQMGAKCIKLSSVVTPELAHWCDKNGYTPVENFSFMTNGYITGDYQRERPATDRAYGGC